MPLEDFTTYTEVDPNSHLDKTANHVDHKGYRNEDCYLYKDKGANHFGDFTHLIDLKPVGHGTTSAGLSTIWMLSVDTVDDIYGIKTAGKTAIAVCCQGYSTASTYLWEMYGSSAYNSAVLSLTYGTQYYLKIVKSGTTLTLYIYTDSARTTQITGSPVSLTLHADHLCRYVFAGNTYNDGTDTNKWVDVDIDNLDLQEENTAYIDRNFTLTAEIPPTALVDKDFILTIGTYTISGVTRDAGGDVIGNCTVQLFRTSDKAFIAETTSSASGTYSFTVNSKVRQHFLIGYKSGTPNRFGTSDRNVVANGSPSQFWGLRQAFDTDPDDVRLYFLQYQTPVDRSLTLIEGITSLVDRTLSVNLRKLALNDRTLAINAELTNVNDRSFSLATEKTDVADRQLNMNVWKSALQDRSVMSIIELFEFLNRSVSASIEPTVLIDRNVSAFIEPTHLIDAKFSLQSELTAFADRTATLDMAGLSHRSLSANIEPYTYVGYEHRSLAVNSELTNSADKSLQLMSELTALADNVLSANIERFILVDRNLSLGMEIYGYTNASNVLSVEQTSLKDRNLSAIIEQFNTNDRSASLFVEPTVFADRNFAVQVGTRGLNDRNLVSNIERFILIDRLFTLSTDKGADVDRSLALQAEKTLSSDSLLTTAVELPTISDRSLNLVAEKTLLQDRQCTLFAEKFALADSNLSVFIEPTRFSDAPLALQSEVTLTADSLLQLNSELFTVSDRNQTVVVELTNFADSLLSISVETPTVSDRSLSLNVERTSYVDSTLTLNSELTLYGDRNLAVNAERILQTDGLLSLSMEALRYADRPFSLNSEVPFAVQDRSLSVFIEPTHLSNVNVLANVERFLYLDKALALDILYKSTNDKSLALTTELTAVQDNSVKLNIAGLLFRNTITNIALPKLTDRSLSMEVEVPYTQKDRLLTLDIELLHKLAYPPLKVKFT